LTTDDNDKGHAAQPVPAPSADGVAAVVIARVDGRVVELNDAAEDIAGGAGVGSDCWELVGKKLCRGAAPCNPGCVGRLIHGGPNETQGHNVVVRGDRYHLSCVPVGSHAVCVLSPLEDKRNEGAAVILSIRELEVLRHIADGDTTREAARKLGIGTATVRTHLEHMRRKMAVSTQAALVAEAFRRGYLK
jgi:DNA-binding CsgD family transcriptional regulator